MSALRILGCAVSLRARTPALSAWLRRHWIFPEHALPPRPYSIRLEEFEHPPATREGTRAETRLHRITLSCLAAQDAWTFGGEAAGVQLRLNGNYSEIRVWGAAADETVVFPALFLAMGESLRASGLIPLHASVAVRGGEATAFAGRSGVGKSTTLWRAIRAGWAPLAEDFAWLDPADLTVYGWDRGLRLWPETRERFAPEVPLSRFRADADGKLFLPYEHLTSPPERGAKLSRVAVLARDAERTTVRAPLAPRDAVRAWWEAVGVPLSGAARDRLARQIPLLLGRVETCRLLLGAGPLPL